MGEDTSGAVYHLLIVIIRESQKINNDISIRVEVSTKIALTKIKFRFYWMIWIGKKLVFET